MKWSKVIISGILATFSMDVAMNGAMYFLEMNPTNIHPAAAFLYNLGVEQSQLATLLHYCYGTLWSVVFVYTFEEDVSEKRGIQLAGVLWFFMMLVYSPIIGWGFFGMGNAKLLTAEHPLYLTSTGEYLFMTLLVHLVYGTVLGFLSRKFVIQK